MHTKGTKEDKDIHSKGSIRREFAKECTRRVINFALVAYEEKLTEEQLLKQVYDAEAKKLLRNAQRFSD